MPKRSTFAPPSPILGELRYPSEYRVGRERFFPSDSSLEWTTRRLRPQLEAAGAIVKLNGRTMIRPEVYDRVLVEDGERAAKKLTACVDG